LIEAGETFGSTCELTWDDLELAVRLTRGRHPVHVDDAAARAAGLEGRIFHGAVSAAIMAAAIGQRFASHDIVILEQANRYRLPVHPGDTVTSRWTVTEGRPGRQPSQLVLGLSGELANQRGDIVLESKAKVLLTSQSWLRKPG
jgi:acyl dehydratase